jgi:transposase
MKCGIILLVIEMKKAEIQYLHGETKVSLKKAKIEFRKIPKAETKITTIMLCLDGHGVLGIKRMLNMSDKTVSKYIRLFNNGGLEELLKYGKGSGKPPKLSKQERDLLAEKILSTPKECNCGESTNWTSKLVQEFIKNEFGKGMGLTGIQALLHRMGFSFTRPTYTLARADKKNL